MPKKSMTLNLVMNGIKTLMTVLFPLITFPYASRVLGTAGIGKVEYASAIISYFALLASLGISTYAVREGAGIQEDKEKFNKFVKEILHINLFTTFTAYIALIVFLNLPILQDYRMLLMIFGIDLLFTTVSMAWLFIIKEEYAYITKRSIFFQFFSLILLFLLVTFSLTISKPSLLLSVLCCFFLICLLILLCQDHLYSGLLRQGNIRRCFYIYRYFVCARLCICF